MGNGKLDGIFPIKISNVDDLNRSRACLRTILEQPAIEILLSGSTSYGDLLLAHPVLKDEEGRDDPELSKDLVSLLEGQLSRWKLWRINLWSYKMVFEFTDLADTRLQSRRYSNRFLTLSRPPIPIQLRFRVTTKLSNSSIPSVKDFTLRMVVNDKMATFKFGYFNFDVAIPHAVRSIKVSDYIMDSDLD